MFVTEVVSRYPLVCKVCQLEEQVETEWGRMWNDVALAYCEILLQLALEKT